MRKATLRYGKEHGVNVIETHGLMKSFGGRTAVDQFDMHVGQGDIYGFVGRN